MSPIGNYDRYFGGERGAAKKALDAMKKTYGPKDGEHVFWAKVAKARRKTKPPRSRPR